MFKRLATSKTAWTILGALGAVGQQYATGQLTGKQASAAAIAGLLTLFMRDGVAKVEEKLN